MDIGREAWVERGGWLDEWTSWAEDGGQASRDGTCEYDLFFSGDLSICSSHIGFAAGPTNWHLGDWVIFS